MKNFKAKTERKGNRASAKNASAKTRVEKKPEHVKKYEKCYGQSTKRKPGIYEKCFS